MDNTNTRYWGFEWYWYWYWYWGFQFCWYWYWYWYWGSEVLKYWGIEIWCGIGIESDQIPAASRFQRFKIIQMSFHIACKDMFLLFKGSVWVLSCTFKLPLWLKAFSHLKQANGNCVKILFLVEILHTLGRKHILASNVKLLAFSSEKICQISGHIVCNNW